VQVIDDRSFFDNIPHTLIDFETRGDGSAWGVPPGNIIRVAPDEYAPLGARITQSIGPVHYTIARTFDTGVGRDLLEVAGSVSHYLVDFAIDGFVRIEFTTNVNAFGLATIRSLASDSGPIIKDVFDTQGALVDTASFLPSLVDGIILGMDPTSSNDDYEHGFFGVYSPEFMIGSILIREDRALFDDLHFAVVPEPCSALLLLIGMSIVWYCVHKPTIEARHIVLGCALASCCNDSTAFGDITGQVQGYVHVAPQSMCGSAAYGGCIDNYFALRPLSSVNVCIQGGACGGVAWPSAAS